MPTPTMHQAGTCTPPRGTSPTNQPRALDQLAEECKALECPQADGEWPVTVSDVIVERVKNRMDPETKLRVFGGYRDVALNLRIDTEETRAMGVETHVCEVQLLLSCFDTIKVRRRLFHAGLLAAGESRAAYMFCIFHEVAHHESFCQSLSPLTCSIDSARMQSHGLYAATQKERFEHLASVAVQDLYFADTDICLQSDQGHKHYVAARNLRSE